MKAKVIATGEIIDVVLVGTNGSSLGQYREMLGSRHFNLNQLHFLKENPINWEQRRFELAKAAMQGLLSYNSIKIYDIVAEHAIGYADAVIEKLKD